MYIKVPSSSSSGEEFTPVTVQRSLPSDVEAAKSEAWTNKSSPSLSVRFKPDPDRGDHLIFNYLNQFDVIEIEHQEAIMDDIIAMCDTDVCYIKALSFSLIKVGVRVSID